MGVLFIYIENIVSLRVIMLKKGQTSELSRGNIVDAAECQ